MGRRWCMLLGVVRRRSCALLGLALVAGPAAAQDRDLAAFQDSLAGITGLRALRALASAPRDTGFAAALVEEGLVRLRLFELTDDPEELDRARRAFESAAERDPRSAWAQYGIGLALARSPELRIPSPGGVLRGFVLPQSLAEIVGQDPRSRARRAFRRALALDPMHARAARQLAALALLSRRKDDLEEARDALARIAAGGRADPEVAVALADVESALGHVGVAAEAAAEAVAAGGDATALHARAAALLRVPGREAEGAAAYFEGIARLTEEAAERYFEDLLPIVTPDEELRWRAGNLDARREWLRTFWELRAALAGEPVADRVAEHYRRLAVAHERYRRAGRRGAPPGGALLRQDPSEREFPFDDRGLVYVRHGEPDRVIQTAHSELRPNETWVYTAPDGTSRLFHFLKLRQGSDFRLVDDLLAALDPTITNLQLEPLIALVQDRAPYDPKYQALLARLNRAEAVRRNRNAAPRDLTDALADIRATSQALAAETRAGTLAALDRDSDRPRFERELPFYYDIFTFRGPRGQTDVTAALAIPGPMLEPAESADGRTLYALRLSFILVDTATGRISRVDTVYRYRAPRPLGEGEYLRTHVRLAAPPSGSAVHRLLVRNDADPGQGRLYGGPARVRDYSGGALLVSDIVLAEPDSGGTWRRGAASLALVPPRQFPAREPVTVFYEIYNLPAGTPYRTEIRLEPPAAPGPLARIGRLLGLGGGGSVRLRFEGQAAPGPDGAVQEIRRVASRMGPGRYRLRVAITDLAGGRTATSETQFLVLE